VNKQKLVLKTTNTALNLQPQTLNCLMSNRKKKFDLTIRPLNWKIHTYLIAIISSKN